MLFRPLGNTDINVSLIALGTMTYGEQVSQAESFEKMDYATDQGLNFIDVAEMYPLPPKPDTFGFSETIVGEWLKSRGARDKTVVATKVTGNSQHNVGFDHIRGGSRLSAEHIKQAVEGSLKRLQTDYIDLYQLHWPDRSTNFFGRLGYQHCADEEAYTLEESLSAMADLVAEGKVRAVGLSNETPWGVMESCRLAEKLGLPRVVSIQNPYNLLNRTYEVGLAEISIRENIGLLAYSPLAFGFLTGKYLDGAKPQNARLTMYDRFSRYNNPQAEAATKAYAVLAAEHGLTLTDMALAFVNRQSFLTSSIIGTTTLDQLKTNLNSIHVVLADDLLNGIERIHQRYSNPAP